MTALLPDLVQGKGPLDVLLAVVQLAGLIALVIYVWKTWEMAAATREYAQLAQATLQQAREASNEEIAPYVAVYFDMPYGKGQVFLVVKNLGRTIADSITLDFKPPLQHSRSATRVPFFAENGIRSLAPGQEIRTFFDTINGLLNLAANLPLHYEVAVSYGSKIEILPRTYTQTLDLNMFRNTGYLGELGVPDVVKAVKEVATQVGNAQREVTRLRRSINVIHSRRRRALFHFVEWLLYQFDPSGQVHKRRDR